MGVPVAVEELVAGARLSAHLATAVGDRPHVAPVWYVYDDGSLSVLTGGRKLRNVRANPRVAVSIERYDADGVDWSATLLGTARVVADEGRYRAVERAIEAKYDGEYGGDAGDVALDHDPDASADTVGALVEVDVGSATAQRY